MNIARRMAALRREISMREGEVVRIAELRANHDPATVAFPEFIEKHLEKVKEGLEERRKELAALERTQSV